MSDNDNTESRFNIPAIKLDRNDSLELQSQIVAMIPAERKKLGINKSTLWYQKRHIAEGKQIKVYGKVLSKLHP